MQSVYIINKTVTILEVTNLIFLLTCNFTITFEETLFTNSSFEIETNGTFDYIFNASVILRKTVVGSFINIKDENLF